MLCRRFASAPSTSAACLHTPRLRRFLASTGLIDFANLKRSELVARQAEIQQHWRQQSGLDVGRKKEDRETRYILAMFPYPSGRLHMGHARVYTMSDLLARYYTLAGYNVIHPIGWDSFGLPAENAARERGVDPGEWTERNIAEMKDQLQRLGLQFDWSREIATSRPDYFKQTQHLFLRLYRRGLVRRQRAEVWWDPVDGTVLANEQIDEKGRSWRSGAPAQKRQLIQWFVETPFYAKKLYHGLDSLEELAWDEVARIQRSWIGTCDAYRFLLPLKENGSPLEYEQLDLRVLDPFRAARATKIVVSPRHSVLQTREWKLGEPVPNLFARHPLLEERWLPIFVEEDGEEMLLNAASVVDGNEGLDARFESVEAIQRAAKDSGTLGYVTSRTHSSWCVSRQRGWGTPIPMLLSQDGTQHRPIPVDELPFRPVQGSTTGSGDAKWRPELDTLDTFFDSAWYYLRFLDPKNEQELASKQALFEPGALPVHVYVGGIEHAVAHLFFARFMCHFLHDEGVVPHSEPFSRLLPQGFVRAPAYQHPKTMKWLRPEELEKRGNETYIRGEPQDLKPLESVEKMSKSKYNGVDPIDLFETDGEDLARLRILYGAAPRAALDWENEDKYGYVAGLKSLVNRMGLIAQKLAKPTGKAPTVDQKLEQQLREARNDFLQKTTVLIDEQHAFNSALHCCFALATILRRLTDEELGSSQEARRAFESLLVVFQIFAPNVSREIWSSVAGDRGELHDQPWPAPDPDSDIDFFVTINGATAARRRLTAAEFRAMETDDEKVLARAKTQDHAVVWRSIDELKFRARKTTVQRRERIYVRVDVWLENVDDEEEKTRQERMKRLYKACSKKPWTSKRKKTEGNAEKGEERAQ